MKGERENVERTGRYMPEQWGFNGALELAFELVCTAPCATGPDLNGDGFVDSADLALLLGAWVVCGECCPADFNQDQVVDAADLAELLGNWNPVE